MNTKINYLDKVFEDSIKSNPESIAIIEAGEESKQITYRQLDDKSDNIAHFLASIGVNSGSLVAIMMDSSIDFVAAILAVLKLNATYIPIDILSPENRKKELITSSNASYLLIDSNHDGKICLESLRVVSINEIPSLSNDESVYTDLKYSTILCNISYTSGTSGSPKGVMISHTGIINHVNWRIREYNYTADDRTLIMVSNTMDGFAAILFTSLFSGGTLVLLPNHKRKDFSFVNYTIEKYKITNFCIVPSMLQGLISHSINLTSVRFITLAGEKTNPKLITQLKDIKKDICIIGEYGSAESTCTTTVNKNFNELTASIIGKPVDNIRVYLLDDMLNETNKGEICIAGDGISLGYFQNNKLTKAKFVNGTKLGEKVIYRTGDLGMKMHDGNIKYIGRKDRQLKLRGIRIEPEQIEQCLTSHDSVSHAIIKEIGSKNANSICAYLIPKNNTVDIETLKGYILEKLPDYYLPSYFVILTEFPLTANGKIDFDKLPPPEKQYENDNYAPKTTMQERLLKIFCSCLDDVEEYIGISDDFFNLGGNSLSAAILLSALNKEFGEEITFENFRKMSTVEKLEEHLSRSEAGVV